MPPSVSLVFESGTIAVRGARGAVTGKLVLPSTDDYDAAVVGIPDGLEDISRPGVEPHMRLLNLGDGLLRKQHSADGALFRQ